MLETLASFLRRRRMHVLKPFGKPSPACACRVSLCDTNGHMARALAAAFAEADQVEVVEGNLLDLSCDALVSPANSFGDMGGGIDKRIDDFHGGAAQRVVMAAIAARFFGELPVGMAIVVELASRRFPFLVAAPTMRIPGNVAGTINAYLAMRAALVAILQHNASSAKGIRSLGVPGLCTGVGGMATEEAATQMRAAYDNVVGGRWQQITHPALAPFAFREPGLRQQRN
jgi:O-acetyl-ADP-ribose deacetylase (regulator of RNase III)